MLVLDRCFTPLARAVDRQRLFQRREDVGVIDDDAAVLAGEDPVGAGDGLHQRVVAHRLVEIHRRAARRIEAGQPHGADEDQAQRVVSLLEFFVEAGVRLVHALAVRFDVEAKRLHLLDFVLPRRNDHRHIGTGQHIESLFQLGHARIAPRLFRRHPASAWQVMQLAQFLPHPCGFRRPMHLDLVEHAHCGGLVDGHHHRLAHKASA